MARRDPLLESLERNAPKLFIAIVVELVALAILWELTTVWSAR